MALQIEQDQGVIIATVIDTVIDAHNGNVFRSELKALLDTYSFVVVNLQHLSFIDSSGIGVILSCMRQARNLGGELMLAEPTPNVQAILNILQMSRVIHICPTKHEAIHLLQQLAQQPNAVSRPPYPS